MTRTMACLTSFHLSIFLSLFFITKQSVSFLFAIWLMIIRKSLLFNILTTSLTDDSILFGHVEFPFEIFDGNQNDFLKSIIRTLIKASQSQKQFF